MFQKQKIFLSFSKYELILALNTLFSHIINLFEPLSYMEYIYIYMSDIKFGVNRTLCLPYKSNRNTGASDILSSKHLLSVHLNLFTIVIRSELTLAALTISLLLRFPHTFSRCVYLAVFHNRIVLRQ